MTIKSTMVFKNKAEDAFWRATYLVALTLKHQFQDQDGRAITSPAVLADNATIEYRTRRVPSTKVSP